jgi:ribosomal protein S12 methylthiotransferase accessory factor YcaO
LLPPLLLLLLLAAVSSDMLLPTRIMCSLPASDGPRGCSWSCKRRKEAVAATKQAVQELCQIRPDDACPTDISAARQNILDRERCCFSQPLPHLHSPVEKRHC